MEELKDRAIFETAAGGYVLADDIGYFSVGDMRGEGKNCKIRLYFFSRLVWEDVSARNVCVYILMGWGGGGGEVTRFLRCTTTNNSNKSRIPLSR